MLFFNTVGLIKYHSTFTVFKFLSSVFPAFFMCDISIFLYDVLRFCVLKVNTKLTWSAPGWCVGNGGSASFFLNLYYRWRSVASFRPRPVPFSRWVGGHQNRSGHCAKKKCFDSADNRSVKPQLLSPLPRRINVKSIEVQEKVEFKSHSKDPFY